MVVLVVDLSSCGRIDDVGAVFSAAITELMMVLNSRASASRPRVLWMWPHARIGVMGGVQAAGVLATV